MGGGIRGRGRRVALAVALAGLLAVVVGGEAQAAPGDLDASFGTGGKATLQIGGFAMANAGALDRQGRIAVTGETDTSGERDMALARFTVAGQLDPAFAGGVGYVTRDPSPAGHDYIDDLIIQPDGKLLVGGTFDWQTGILRYHENGLPDTGFGSGGQVKHSFGHDQRTGGLILLPNGQIHWYGRGPYPGTTDLELSRFDADGTLDGGFGAGGLAQVSGGPGLEQYHAGLALPDGKLLIGGETGGIPLTGTIFRLTAAGVPDPGFGTAGKVNTAGFGSEDFIYDLALDDQGRIVAVGTGGATDDVTISRFLADGQPDPSFNGNGRRQIDFGGFDSARGVVIQPNGKIVLAGYTDANGHNDMLITRLNSDGATDTSFGSNGASIVDFAADDDEARDLLLQPDGALVLVGSASYPGSLRIAIARIEGDPPPAAPPAGGPPQAKPDRTVRIAILGKRARVNRRGVARLRLRCPAGEASPPCRGIVSLRTARKVRPSAKAKPRRVQLGRARYRIVAGKTKTVRIKLGRAKRRLLRRNRKARRIVVIARTRDAAGNRSVNRKRLIAQIPRR